jgi:Molecular chaperone (small heat shock protein)
MEDKDQEEKVKEPEEEESVGVAGGVLRGLGKLIPGLGDVTKGLEKSDAFQQRLSVINKEVERQLKEAPLKKVGQEGARRTIIPPTNRVRGTVNGHGFRQPPSRAEAPPLKKQREVIVDIFDEGDYIKVIAELPGVTEQDIKTELRGKVLIISATSLSREYYKEVTLPCSIKGEMNSSYNNGILQIELGKK